MTTAGPQVVDVKPARRAERPEVAFTFAWSRQIVEARGWGYVVRSEPDPVRLANIRFLARCRRAWLFAPEVVELLDGVVRDGMTLGDAFVSVPEVEARYARAAVLHLLWQGRVVTDLSAPLGPASVLRRPR
jgi:hypothetical protein